MGSYTLIEVQRRSRMVLVEALAGSPAGLACRPFAFVSVPADELHSQSSALAIVLPQGSEGLNDTPEPLTFTSDPLITLCFPGSNSEPVHWGNCSLHH